MEKTGGAHGRLVCSRARMGLKSGFDPPDLERPGRLPHQQGLCEARLDYQDE